MKGIGACAEWGNAIDLALLKEQMGVAYSKYVEAQVAAALLKALEVIESKDDYVSILPLVGDEKISESLPAEVKKAVFETLRKINPVMADAFERVDQKRMKPPCTQPTARNQPIILKQT